MDDTTVKPSENTDIPSILYNAIARLQDKEDIVKVAAQLERDIEPDARSDALKGVLERMKKSSSMVSGPGIDPHTAFSEELEAIANPPTAGRRRRRRGARKSRKLKRKSRKAATRRR